MDRLIHVKRLSDRVVDGDPSGTWKVGDSAYLPADEARALLASKLVELASGESLPSPIAEAKAAASVFETASLTAGEIPAGESAGKASPRDRGR